MRLIDADALDFEEYVLHGRGGTIFADFMGIMKKIGDAPTIDAAPVIRCRECKYIRAYSKHTFMAYYCENIRGPAEDIEPDDFCSHGERRNDNAE